jgi:hypothetical protein
MTDNLPPEEAAHSGPTGDPVPYVLDPNTGFLIPYAVNRNTGNLTPYVPAEGINLFVPGYTAPYILRGGIPQVFTAQHSADIPDVNTSEEELDYSKLLHSFFPDTIPDDRFLSSDDAARYFAEFIRDILNTQASSLELANLAGQLEKVKSNEDAQGATDRIANETPFTNVAKKIHEVNHKHGPGWGSYIAGLAVPIVLQLSGWLGQTQPPAPPPEPIPISVIYEGAPTVPGPAPAPASIVFRGTVRATENTAESTYSTAPSLTGPPDVSVVINVLRHLGPSQTAQLSLQQQYQFAQRMFAEMGKMVSHQSNVSAGQSEQSDISSSDD